MAEADLSSGNASTAVKEAVGFWRAHRQNGGVCDVVLSMRVDINDGRN
jgi:hypothetical protein